MIDPMPPNIAVIRDAAIDHALHGTPLPLNIDELYEWLVIHKIYGSDELIYDFYFHLTDIEFSDDALKWNEELDSTVTINDSMRVAHGRKEIESYVNGYNDNLHSPEAIKLENNKGESTYACGIGYMTGQGGIEMTWHGFYESREKYLEYLRANGMLDSAEIDQIKDAEILALWKYE